MIKIKIKTWAELHKALNEMPESEFDKPIQILTDERTLTASDIEILKEDHYFDGDEHSVPESDLRAEIGEEVVLPNEDFYLVATKGSYFLSAD